MTSCLEATPIKSNGYQIFLGQPFMKLTRLSFSIFFFFAVNRLNFGAIQKIRDTILPCLRPPGPFPMCHLVTLARTPTPACDVTF